MTRTEEIITEAEHHAKQQGVTVDPFVIGYLAAQIELLEKRLTDSEHMKSIFLRRQAG